MKYAKRYTLIVLLALGMMVSPVFGASYYSKTLCYKAGYTCMKIRRGQSWRSLWPDAQKRRIVMRVNRTSYPLWAGRVIAVPDNLPNITHMDVAPFPYFMATGGERIIVLDLSKHAFGAYDSNGYLVHWGPVSGGKGWCPDINRRCNTPRGDFKIFRKGDEYCESSIYPIPEGGAPMYYCMFFHRGFAMHYGDLPGYHASHGCVRMFYEDAEWLNTTFVRVSPNGTRVIVR